MSETEDRKSMDDVLASIRRIVRAEKDPEPTAVAEDMQQRPASEQGSGNVDEPLALTPDMMMTESDAGEAQPADVMPDPVADVPAAVENAVENAAAIDPEHMREMVREVVLEQLSGDQAGELVRGIIRDELVSGDIGSNISQNVMALIKSEVGKALKG